MQSQAKIIQELKARAYECERLFFGGDIDLWISQNAPELDSEINSKMEVF